MNPMDKYNQLMNGIRNPSSLDKGLSFGPHGGMFSNVAPSQNINPGRDNPNGYTGAHQSNGAGFSGSTAHFNTVGSPQMNAKPIYDPTRGVYQKVTYDPNSVGNPEMAAKQAKYAEEAAAVYQHENGYEVTANGGVLPGSDPSDREAVMPNAQGEYEGVTTTPVGTNPVVEDVLPPETVETPAIEAPTIETPTIETPTIETPTPENPNVDERPIDWNGGGGRPDFASNYDPRGKSTPFLDAYIRSKEQARAPGPVSGMMSKYME